ASRSDWPVQNCCAPLAMNFSLRVVFWRALISLACVGLAACSTIRREPIGGLRKCPEGSPTIKIGTYNVYVGTLNLKKSASVIRTMNADVVALQEVRPRAAKTLDREFAREYRYRYFSSGLGLMSRLPLRNVRFERSE